jgi:hypothetical protein
MTGGFIEQNGFAVSKTSSGDGGCFQSQTNTVKSSLMNFLFIVELLEKAVNRKKKAFVYRDALGKRVVCRWSVHPCLTSTTAGMINGRLLLVRVVVCLLNREAQSLGLNQQHQLRLRARGCNLMTTDLKKLTATMAGIKRRYPSGGRRYSMIVENPLESGYWPLPKPTKADLVAIRRFKKKHPTARRQKTEAYSSTRRFAF